LRPSKVRAVHRVDRFLRLFRRAHRNEGKAAWPARGAIHHQVGLGHGAMRRKGVLQIFFGGIERKVSRSLVYPVFSKLFPVFGFQIITETKFT